ncbi:MAG: glycosyltransferase [Solobacterium sp.]|jgi:glycosyltransferase involved in cell wall biosynthesis|nr:glycosyltransferase [Solobacterium sp.]MCH4049498.1 glycosyltransferase [Solobacterium sp.]MCH4075355.1 glycosyltransferase [Solobacterium sp.]
MEKKVLVLSGINLVDGGALSVYQDCLNELISCGYGEKCKIYALVNSKKFFNTNKQVEYIEFPRSKQSWLFRLYYEYFYFKKLSKRLNAYYWISLHDITPNVHATKQYVYCHNPSPFNRMKITDAKYGWKYYLFSKFYKYLYAINIKKNTAVIVQQDWMRKEFKKMFQIDNIIVSRPSIPATKTIVSAPAEKTIFVCPSYPRYYKNFEVVCKAARLLNEKGINNFQVIITVDGTENKYSKDLVKEFNNVESIDFTGLLSRNNLYDVYSKSKCLIFMSKLETWGMPIIEFKSTGQGMILADLPYCHETCGNYDNVSFVRPDDFNRLAVEMKKIIDGDKLGINRISKPNTPFAKDWRELFSMIL